MNPINFLKAALGVATLIFLWGWIRAGVWEKSFPSPKLILIGFITDFFDTLGIGSYAPTTSLFKVTKTVDDRVIPGTMNIGHTLPTVVETLIYLTIVPVDPVTLFSMLAAAMFGAWIGAGVVAKLSKRAVQIGMAIALSTAVVLLFSKQMGWFPGGGDALGVTGVKLAIAVSINFVLGALMTAGIGMYAPCMITVYLLGMSPKAAFPIMMGSCAFLMPVGTFPFLREKSYNNRAALGLTLGGIPGVLMAAYIFYQLSIQWVLWLVIGVSIVTALSLIRSVSRPVSTSS
jgi:uncharacterized membrane protein YfcA